MYKVILHDRKRNNYHEVVVNADSSLEVVQYFDTHGTQRFELTAALSIREITDPDRIRSGENTVFLDLNKLKKGEK